MAKAGRVSTEVGTFDRRSALGAGLRVGLSAVALLTFYFLLPFSEVGLLESFLRFAGGIIVIVVFVGWQARAIVTSERPQLRSIEAVALSFLLLVVVFAIIYVSISRVNPDSFSESLSPVAGIYFTMSVLATVGFGDVAAVTDAARVVVTLQMLLDLLLIGVVVQVLLRAGKAAAASRSSNEQSRS